MDWWIRPRLAIVPFFATAASFFLVEAIGLSSLRAAWIALGAVFVVLAVLGGGLFHP